MRKVNLMNLSFEFQSTLHSFRIHCHSLRILAFLLRFNSYFIFYSIINTLTLISLFILFSLFNFYKYFNKWLLKDINNIALIS